MGKIIKGHSFDEYQKKYGKKFNNGKLQFVKLTDKDKLDAKKTYWLIEDNNPGYYQVSNFNYVFPIAILGTAALVIAIVVPCMLLLGPKSDVYHTIKFVSDGNCTMHEVTDSFDEVIEKQFKEGETAEFIIVSNENYSLPTVDQVSFKTPDGKEIAKDNYHYDPKDNAKFSVKMMQDVIVTATATKATPSDYTIKLKNAISGVTITPNVVKPEEITDFDTKIIIAYQGEDHKYYKILPGDSPIVEITEGTNGGDEQKIECEYEPEYDYASAYIHVPSELFKGSITIDFTLVDWYKNQNYMDGLAKKGEKDKSFITANGGITHPLKVNGVDHTVRLIGTKEDKDGSGNDISTTWEFANLISDKDGRSLATQWNDTNETNSNYDYFNSSVRYALNKKGECNHILWAQKGATTWSTDSLYKDKCVLDMLPFGFEDVLKTPSKYININEGSAWEEKTVEDKLFLLSPAEMGKTGHADEETTTVTYSYYVNAENLARVKKQVNNEGIYNPKEEDDKPKISDGQVFTGKVDNCAGYNASTDKSKGGNFWLRSPRTSYKNNSWIVGLAGSLVGNKRVEGTALPIAPAFCI